MKLILVIDTDSYQMIGAATSEEKAKRGLTDGEYLFVPFETDTQYPEGYFAAGAPGAITYTPETDGLASTIAANTAAVDLLRSQALTKFNEIEARLDALELPA